MLLAVAKADEFAALATTLEMDDCALLIADGTALLKADASDWRMLMIDEAVDWAPAAAATTAGEVIAVELVAELTAD